MYEVQEEEDNIFLGTIAADGDPWTVDLKDRMVTFMTLVLT